MTLLFVRGDNARSYFWPPRYHNRMDNDNLRQEAATSPDLSRPATTSGDNDYSLTIEEVSVLYAEAGLPRDPRTIQRYCASGKLVCHRIETGFGEKYLITPASVATHIGYIKEVRQAATGRDGSRRVAPIVAAENKGEPETPAAATSPDQSRQAATDSMSQPVAATDPTVKLLERENEFLREQIKVKDKQIAEQSERTRETNLLVNNLQRILAPLIGAPETPRQPEQDPSPLSPSRPGRKWIRW